MADSKGETMETSFSISDRPAKEVPGIVVADLSGDLDTEAAYELESSLSDIVSQEGVKVVLNFSKIRIMNSTAMGVLLSAAEEARKRGGTMKLCSLSDHVREVLDLVGVSSLFEIFPSEAEAVGSFK
jgi:anti-sigma B factor antagonist